MSKNFKGFRSQFKNIYNSVAEKAAENGADRNMFDNDETSSFDGKAFVSKNKGILIGLGIGIVAILVLNKMKVFK